MVFTSNYQSYAEDALADFRRKDAASRNLLVDAVKDLKPSRILDVGCGAGQELLPFLEKTTGFCVGLDTADEIGKAVLKTGNLTGENERLTFVRSFGEKLPFADETFDVVLCRVAIPYMNNREAIAEIGRVMRGGGIFLLKIHSPAFYFGMFPARIKTLNPKNIAYPLICLAGGVWHQITGKQPQKGFWKGKEIYQTRGFLEKEFAENGLKIKGVLPDDNRQTPSFIIEKAE